jgi:hypothetical protein
VRRPKSSLGKFLREAVSGKRSLPGTAAKWVKMRELTSMDFLRGVSEMADAIQNKRRCLLSPQFALHINELTLAVQNAGAEAASYLSNRFQPRPPFRGQSRPL